MTIDHEFDIQRWIITAHPYKYDNIEQKKYYNFCVIYKNADSVYRGKVNQTSNELRKCDRFKQIPLYQSLILQYELYCSRDFLVPASQSFHLLGVLLGALVANWMIKT